MARTFSWGLSESPLVLQDRILVNPGGRGASIVALKKTDGSAIWNSRRRAGLFVRGAARSHRRHPR